MSPITTHPAERGQLTDEQIAVLLRPIKPERVFQSQGQSHVAIFDVTAHLNRVFGFDGWDKEILELSVVSERSEPTINAAGNRTGERAWVTYRCQLRLTVRDPEGRVVKVIEEAATGSAQNQPTIGDAHDMACKNAISYAVKRCAKDLGDQFGLSLYNKGSRGPLVGKTLVDRAKSVAADTQPTAPAALDEHVEQVEGEGDDPTVEPSAAPNEAAQPQEPASPESSHDSRMTTAPEPNAPQTGSQPVSQGAEGHPLDGILDQLDVPRVRGKSTLLREAIDVARDLDMHVTLGWDDLREGPVRDALLRNHGFEVPE